MDTCIDGLIKDAQGPADEIASIVRGLTALSTIRQEPETNAAIFALLQQYQGLKNALNELIEHLEKSKLARDNLDAMGFPRLPSLDILPTVEKDIDEDLVDMEKAREHLKGKGITVTGTFRALPEEMIG